MTRKYTLNTDLFASINTQAEAYCLGFLLADGWLMQSSRGISVAVNSKDIAVLKNIRETAGSNAPLAIKKAHPSSWARGEQLVLGLYSAQMIRNLLALGFAETKAKRMGLPQVNDDLLPHLIRGLMDGDGSIGKRRQFWLSGTTSVLNDVVAIGAKIGVKLSIGIGNGYPRLTGSWKARPFLEWMYSGADFCLARKHETFLAYW